MQTIDVLLAAEHMFSALYGRRTTLSYALHSLAVFLQRPVSPRLSDDLADGNQRGTLSCISILALDRHLKTQV
jgi:hypothetical protein